MLTHYDVLQVARNASSEVISAAYRSLSKSYHPDRHPGDDRAARIMTQINASYSLLSDPIARARYDEWLVRAERSAEAASKASDPVATYHDDSESGRKRRRVPWHKAAFALIPFIVVAWVLATTPSRSSAPPPYVPSPPPQTEDPRLERLRQRVREAQAQTHAQAAAPAPRWSRPALSPYGQPWPSSAGYISNAPRRHTDGLSTMTVDNSQNDADVHVKLVSLNASEAYAVREFFIPAFSRFTASAVRAGSYDVRYRDLTSGALSRSEAFLLEEISRDGGTDYTNLTLTLYKVANGNMQTYPLEESDF